MELNTPISLLNRVGKTTAIRLRKIGIKTVQDLLLYFPFRYEDYSQVKLIGDVNKSEAITVKGKIQLIASRRSFRKRTNVTEALIADDTGSMKIVWFNQPYLTKTFKVGDEVYISGRFDDIRFQMVSPEIEPVRQAQGDTLNTARIVPVYHVTDGLTQKQLRFLFKQAFPVIQEIAEFLPEDILKRNNFKSLKDCIRTIHFPKDLAEVKQSEKRLKFDEMFMIQLAIQKFRAELGENKAPQIKFLEKQTKDFVDSLPYELTKAQKKCSWEIIQSMEQTKAMNRLLEGDVGSGKTIVVGLALLNVVLNGYKAIVMAPTEILAEQHYQTFSKLFEKLNFKVCLFTGSKRLIGEEKVTKKVMLEKLETAEFDIVIGTHAIIQKNVTVKELGLVVIDEQHRFGVKQRKALLKRDSNAELVPHFLSMTATPIPRSLVLTLYGDLDLSVINEMPAGRKPIKTKVVYEENRYKAYEFIQKQIDEGRQVFVICPLIDPSDKLGVKSVKQEFENLDKNIFPDLKIGLMHGRLKSKEKESVMSDFKDKKFDILVSTSVIEVGIDIPNASIMMIEGADRFGLAQLHQFRGRVGRGEHQSYCFLFSDNQSEQTRTRLHYLEECTDGFQLAEKDLELRGSGEVYGIRQSGLPDLKIATLTDVDVIQLAQKEAKEIIENKKITPELQSELDKVNISMHFE